MRSNLLLLLTGCLSLDIRRTEFQTNRPSTYCPPGKRQIADMNWTRKKKLRKLRKTYISYGCFRLNSDIIFVKLLFAIFLKYHGKILSKIKVNIHLFITCHLIIFFLTIKILLNLTKTKSPKELRNFVLSFFTFFWKNVILMLSVTIVSPN